MNVSLTPALEKFVAQKVQSGLYQTASEVIREGLRLLEERDALHQARLDDIRQAIQDGNTQLARGEGLPGEEVFAQSVPRVAHDVMSHHEWVHPLTPGGPGSTTMRTGSMSLRNNLDAADRSHRFWPVRDFLIIYHPETSPLEIVRILRGSRDIPSLI